MAAIGNQHGIEGEGLCACLVFMFLFERDRCLLGLAVHGDDRTGHAPLMRQGLQVAIQHMAEAGAVDAQTVGLFAKGAIVAVHDGAAGTGMSHQSIDMRAVTAHGLIEAHAVEDGEPGGL